MAAVVSSLGLDTLGDCILVDQDFDHPIHCSLSYSQDGSIVKSAQLPFQLKNQITQPLNLKLRSRTFLQ